MIDPLLLLLLAVGASPALVGAGGCPRAIEAVVETSWLTSPERSVGVLLLDATGDREPEVLVADPDSGGNAGVSWSVYRQHEGGEHTAIGSVFFHRLGFKLEGRELKTYLRLNASSGRFITYRVLDDSIEEVSSTAVLASGESEYESRWGEIAAWRENVRGAYFVVSSPSTQESDEGTLTCEAFD